MMFPKGIYEVLPYTYMSVGIVEIGFVESIMATISGVVLFLAGAIVWVMRSNARRTDPVTTRRNTNSGEILYELKPFILIMLGAMVITYFNYWMVYPIAGLVCLLGFYIILIRNTHRHRRVKLRKS